jgi:predicted enzyme related to lactoylglutathione lyase
MGSRLHSVAVDSTDPARLARWWAEVLDYQIVDEEHDEVSIAPDKNAYPNLIFLLVPDAKSVKNRLHFDLNPDDQEAEVERLVDMGAHPVDVGQGDDVTWVVLADPEGNEFCVLGAH